MVIVDFNDGLVLLGHEGAARQGRGQHVDEELVGQYVQLLDGLALDVRVASLPEDVGDAGSPDGRADRLHGRLDAHQELGQVTNLLTNIFTPVIFTENVFY